MKTISFYDELLPAILNRDKTITIRSLSALSHQVGSRMEVISHSTGQLACEIEITAVRIISFQDINETHARKEQMTLKALKKLIGDIYPSEQELVVISFKLI